MGPAFSLIVGVMCLLIARRRPTFFWVTAAFTNATLRLFPLVFDVSRATQKAERFSDEGNIVLAFTANSTGRAIVLLAIFAIFLSLTVLVARRYDFPRYRTAKVIGIYLLSLAVGISLVLVDEMLK